jgi:S1-C subfamily serine protease
MVVKKSFRTLTAFATAFLLSLAVWSVVAAQESTPESTPEATVSERPFLGVRLENVDDTVVIRAVVADSAAAEAGLQEEDVLTAVNGTDVASASEVADLISGLNPGDIVTIDYTRDGESSSVDVTLGVTTAEAGAVRGLPRGERGLRGLMGIGINYNAEDQTLEITELSEDNPLYAAGLRAGDTITAINGEPIELSTLPELLAGSDGTVTLTVDRDGETLDIDVTLSDFGPFGMALPFDFGNRGRGNGRGDGLPFDFNGMPFGMFSNQSWLGVTFVNLDEETAAEHEVDQTEGALITEIMPGSPAETAGLQANDVVTAVNGEPVNEEWTLRDRLAAYEPDDTVTLDVLRDGESQQIEVTLGQPQTAADMMPFFNFGDLGSQLPDNHPPITSDGQPNI